MKQSPLYGEWCTFSSLSRNAFWGLRYGRLRISAGPSVYWFALYHDRLMVKFLGIPFCKIKTSDIEHVEFWTSIYGARMQIFQANSTRTIVLSVSEPKRSQEIFESLGISWEFGDESLYWGPGAKS